MQLFGYILDHQSLHVLSTRFPVTHPPPAKRPHHSYPQQCVEYVEHTTQACISSTAEDTTHDTHTKTYTHTHTKKTDTDTDPDPDPDPDPDTYIQRYTHTDTPCGGPLGVIFDEQNTVLQVGEEMAPDSVALGQVLVHQDLLDSGLFSSERTQTSCFFAPRSRTTNIFWHT